jgi:glycosyltransferase involved in cell wall biosynthesis
MVAYACSPNHGSEPGTGWHRAVEAAKFADTWVICEEHEFAEMVRRHQATHGPIEGLHFEFVPKRGWERALARVPGFYYLTYNLWHRRAFRRVCQLHAALSFDLAHQANMCGFREPGYLWKLDVPFVWGPIGGTQNVPWRFLPWLGWRAGLSEGLRSIANNVQLRLSGRVRCAAKKASVVLAANSTGVRDVRRVLGVASRRMLEIGAVRPIGSSTERIAATNSPGALRILWCGLCQPFKALPLLLDALAQLNAEVPFELRVAGDGPSRRSWQRQARRLGIEDHVTWTGWLSHAEVIRQYPWADIFAFTSLRDTGGTVVLEALAAGVPVLCLDHQGVGDMITDGCGVKIPVSTPSRVVEGLAAALRELYLDPERLGCLARGALRRAEDYLWARQGERMAKVYREVLDMAPRQGVQQPGILPYRQSDERGVVTSSGMSAGSVLPRRD